MNIGCRGVIGILGFGVVSACGGNPPASSPNTSNDTQVGAPSLPGDRTQPGSACTGITVPAVTPADLKTFEVTDARCSYAGTDLLGNLYVSVYREWVINDFVVTSTGQTLNADLAVLLRSGFAGFDDYDESQPVRHYRTYSPEGAVLASLEFPNGTVTVWPRASWDTQTPNAGSVLARGQCDDGGATSTIDLFYFDDDNTLTRTAKVTGQGCMEWSPQAVVDAAGFTLLVYTTGYRSATFGVAPRRFAARWLDPSGTPVTDWFDAGLPVEIGFIVQPLIGGGVALSSNASSWMFFPSGKAQAEQPPALALLKTAHVLRIVLGGKAYAVVSRASATGFSATVNAPTGEVCAQFPLPPLGDVNGYFHIGRDGTVMAIDRQSCTVSYYPGLLK